MGAKMMAIKTDNAVFLSAEWRKLIMVNYIVPPEMLQQFIPAGTELDFWEGKCYVSLVGFMFMNTTIRGWKIPFHQNFEEVNLRFYVRRKHGTDRRRGVVFIKEIVPKPMIALVANTLYGENYVPRQMSHLWQYVPDDMKIEYKWKPLFGRSWNEISVHFSPEAMPIAPGSEAEFITEHYWGYAKKDHHRSMEYEVRHPQWNVYPVSNFAVSGYLKEEYGDAFASVFSQSASSVFLAEGSEVEVLSGKILCVD